MKIALLHAQVSNTNMKYYLKSIKLMVCFDIGSKFIIGSSKIGII